MFFDMLYSAMSAKTPAQKCTEIEALARISKIALASAQSYESIKSRHSPIYPLKQPSYVGFCMITYPTRIRRPKHIKSEQSLAKMLHSIVHIEYSAIDLALDAMYRFRDLPLSYYHDWLEVALEEMRHFRLLHECLNALGYEYGDFPVHTQLFDAQKATSDMSDRMALLHRGLEANGLDANPFVVSKIKHFEHTLRDRLLAVLEVILHDEIAHVKKGNKWWRYSHTNASTQEFLATLERFRAFYSPPLILNIQARIQSGFSTEELRMMSRHYSV